jgi:hypothetical protein
MWCIPTLTQEYTRRMIDILEVYERPYHPKQPVVCFDEKSKQLLADIRTSLPMRQGKPRRQDYEYKRKGTVNLFVAVEPKAGRRRVTVTKRRRKPDFAKAIKQLVLIDYKHAEKIVLVIDNLNTHTEKCIRDELPKEEAEEILKKLEWHYTPTHASWLNMAEIEIGILSDQCLKIRIATIEEMSRHVAAWVHDRNKIGAGITWRFTRTKAQEKFKFCILRKFKG